MSEAAVVGIDTDAVTAWVAGIMPELTGPLTFERIGLGQSNLTYLIGEASGRRWVLRRPPLGTLLASAHDVAREARILSALEHSAVPVPRVLAVTDDPSSPTRHSSSWNSSTGSSSTG